MSGCEQSQQGPALIRSLRGAGALRGRQRGKPTTVISAFGTPVRTATPHVDQNELPNNFLVNEPSLSTQGIGGSSGR
jgi:hypothetical protein